MANKGNNKSDKKVLIISLIVAAVLLIVIVLILNKDLIFKTEIPYVPPEEKGDNYVVYDGVKSNNSIEFRQPKKYDIYTISSATLTYEDGATTFIALVKAPDKKEKIAGKAVKINMLDENKKVFVTLNAYIPDLLPNETGAINAVIGADIVDAFDYEIVDNK